MTSDEKLQAIYERGHYFYITSGMTLLFCQYFTGERCKNDAKIMVEKSFNNIKDAIDWLYENTVGKK